MTTRNLRRWPSSKLLRVATITRCCHSARRVPSARRSRRPDEADDVLDVAHGLLGDDRSAAGAVVQNRVDMAGIGEKPPHLAGDRGKLGDGKVGKGWLEHRELGAGE